ncbi:MAG TPA: shikimate dehydrogenase [Tepidisphaeraceae bacterium]|jgi:3-dehydroquinate dehydratase/shikimate dehydrogenase|nr:shikimate dehydrogenase [Tepidisphaeraceae bacterium]
MAHLCVAIFVTDLAQAQRDVATAAEAGADMVELRIDELTDATLVVGVVKAATLPAIVTCRPTWEGGQSTLTDAERLDLLTKATEAGASYIDIELETFRRAGGLPGEWGTTPREQRAGVFVSSHDFAGRPARLTTTLSELYAAPADVTKIIWTARTVRDNLEAFEILQRRVKPTIALCMGEAGLISRVLAKKFGAFLSFAALKAGGGTAPGQVGVADMKRLYRWDALGAKTKVYGVVGSPVAHSMSPAIHNAGFDAAGFDGVYLPLLVNEGYESLKAFMESFVPFEGLDLSGLSVTIPHKENALRYLQEKGGEIEPLAASIGAVNTIVIDRADGSIKLRGLSTDYAAILDSITAKLGISREKLADYRIAVIGAGGTGRTAVAALAHYGATVVVYNRTFERAEALASEFNGRTGKVVAARMEKLCDSCCQIYLNTTSVGMHPNVGQSAWGDAPPTLDAESVVFDTVYNPMKTKLLVQAETAGAKTIGGVEMFVRQAAAQFEAWTGKPAPVEMMRHVVEKRLA